MAGSLTNFSRLREDLILTRAEPNAFGAPVWIIHDPVTSQFLQLGFEAYQLLSVWNEAASFEEVAGLAEERYGRMVDQAEVMALARTCAVARLFVPEGEGDWLQLERAGGHKHSLFMTFAHNYVFFKVPVLKPDRLNARLWPIVRPLFTRGFAVASLLAGLLGLYFVSRDWEGFTSAFPYFFTFGGMAVSLLTVVIVKSLHEMGHSLMAHKFGCRTRTIGIGFMLLTPMLYADVTDSWRLKDRRQRMMIDIAGILVELVLAAWCLLFWSFLPDGALRSAAHTTATVSLAMSLLVNLNPMSRFDGYYILADALGMPNMQTRAFAHMRHLIRRALFGEIAPPPERFGPGRGALVLAIALATAVYRLSLYLGIALVVYHFFIKTLGILMFGFEVFFFLFLPIWNEVKVCYSMRDKILVQGRSLITGGVALLLLILCAIPLPQTIVAPAQLESTRLQRVFPAAPGRIARVAVRNGDQVQPGQLLFVLEAPSEEAKRRVALARKRAAETQLARIAADREDLSDRAVLVEQINGFESEIEGLDASAARREIRADSAGRVSDLPVWLAQGQWVSSHDQLALVTGGAGAVSRGYLRARDLHLVDAGASAWFIPDDLTAPRLKLRVSGIAEAAAATIDMAGLTTQSGGRIAVEPDKDRQLVPEEAQYPIRAAAESAEPPLSARRGVLLIRGRAEPLLSGVFRQVVRVLMRESFV